MIQGTQKKQVLFIQGGGDDGYEADEKLADSLRAELGSAYDVRYPRMQVEKDAPDFGWGAQIGEQIASIEGEVILVGHSLGASILLKYLSENTVSQPIS